MTLPDWVVIAVGIGVVIDLVCMPLVFMAGYKVGHR